MCEKLWRPESLAQIGLIGTMYDDQGRDKREHNYRETNREPDKEELAP
jgi:hypothetical protein